MWIFIRLILALAGFAIRTLAKGRKRPPTGEHAGTPYTSSIRRGKGGVRSFEIGMFRTTPSWIRLHRESAADRAFKAMGVANEIQTGDAAFDREVYITCDHPHVATVLTASRDLRHAILAMFHAGYRKIFFDGRRVRAERSASYEPTTSDLQLLHAVWTASRKLEDAAPSRLADRFLWKALVVEGVIWSVAGFAIGAFIEKFATKGDYHVYGTPVTKLGFMVAGVALCALLVVIALWMRGSSRGHRVIVESLIVLLLSLPIASIQLVSDTNRSFDSAPPKIIETTFTSCEVREHRGRRGRKSYTYRLHANGADVPRTPIETTRAMCSAANESTTNKVSIAIGPGRWGLAWYRWIKIDETTWTNL